MRNKLLRLLMLLMIMTSITSCSVIGGIFKAGMGVGIFFVVIIVIILFFIISKFTGKK